MFDYFNEKWYYDGELGAIYSKESTTFKVWSPMSSKIVLRIYENGTPVSVNSTLGSDVLYKEEEMVFGEKGVFESTLENIWAATNTLATDPSSLTYRLAFQESIVAFLSETETAINKLDSLQEEINQEIGNTVHNVRQAYKGKGKTKLTQEMIDKLKLPINNKKSEKIKGFLNKKPIK